MVHHDISKQGPGVRFDRRLDDGIRLDLVLGNDDGLYDEKRFGGRKQLVLVVDGDIDLKCFEFVVTYEQQKEQDGTADGGE